VQNLTSASVSRSLPPKKGELLFQLNNGSISFTTTLTNSCAASSLSASDCARWPAKIKGIALEKKVSTKKSSRAR
jgi:hypothetical protein